MALRDWLPNSIFKRQIGENDRFKLYDAAKGSNDLVQRMQLLRTLPIHKGCVNSICWSSSGEYILSGSDDQHLCITEATTGKIVEKYLTSHRANIFCAKYLPLSGDKKLISAAGDGAILYTDLERREETLTNKFCCHWGTAYEVVTVLEEPHTFLSCGEDGTVRWYDLRIKEKCSDRHCKENILVGMRRSVCAIAVNPLIPYQLAVGSSDSLVNMYDRRMLPRQRSARGDGAELCRFAVPELENQAHRITSLCYSPEGDQLLTSYSSDFIYLFDLKDPSERRAFHTDSSLEKLNYPPMKRLRLRGDWSDTGPNARPENEGRGRPTVHSDIMHQVTLVLSHLLNHRMARLIAESQGESPESSGSESEGPSRQAEELSQLSLGNSEAEETEETATTIRGGEEDYASTDEEDILLGRPVAEIEKLRDELASSSNCDKTIKKRSHEKKSVKRIGYTSKYTGHRNARTMIKESTFWGRNHIVSGSDCGHVFFWDRKTAEPTMVLSADNHVVNCVQPHPFDTVLATSGIDYDVKLWAPTKCDSGFDSIYAQELMRRNAVMLEETRDTITVPPTFIVRMLSTLNQLRRVRERRQQRMAEGAQQEEGADAQGEEGQS